MCNLNRNLYKYIPGYIKTIYGLKEYFRPEDSDKYQINYRDNFDNRVEVIYFKDKTKRMPNVIYFYYNDMFISYTYDDQDRIELLEVRDSNHNKYKFYFYYDVLTNVLLVSSKEGITCFDVLEDNSIEQSFHFSSYNIKLNDIKYNLKQNLIYNIYEDKYPNIVKAKVEEKKEEAIKNVTSINEIHEVIETYDKMLKEHTNSIQKISSFLLIYSELNIKESIDEIYQEVISYYFNITHKFNNLTKLNDNYSSLSIEKTDDINEKYFNEKNKLNEEIESHYNYFNKHIKNINEHIELFEYCHLVMNHKKYKTCLSIKDIVENLTIKQDEIKTLLKIGD